MNNGILACMLAVALVTPAAAASWSYGGFALDVQGQKGQGRAQEWDQRERGSGAERQGQRGERRDHLSDAERRALHRDLDKANRELYKRRSR